MAGRFIQRTLATFMALAALACSLFLSKESRYLMSAKDHATEAEVRQHLGEPLHIGSDEKGHVQWMYETRTHVQEGTNNAWTTFESWRCDSYTLTFDEHHILRRWSHASRTCE